MQADKIFFVMLKEGKRLRQTLSQSYNFFDDENYLIKVN